MNLFLYILIFSSLGGVSAIIASLLLLTQEKLTKKITIFLVSFAAGVLLGVAFLDLLPEALENNQDLLKIFLFTLIGIILFLLLEKMLFWYHCHEDDCFEHPYVYTALFGDGLHNFIDGMIISVSFLSGGIGLGVSTAIAVAMHEIPGEIGDFSILLHGGMQKMKAFIYNTLIALSAPLGGALIYFSSFKIESILPFLTALAAGNFIYIALTDLIPQIHRQTKISLSLIQIMFLIFGILMVWIIS